MVHQQGLRRLPRFVGSGAGRGRAPPMAVATRGSRAWILTWIGRATVERYRMAQRAQRAASTGLLIIYLFSKFMNIDGYYFRLYKLGFTVTRR